MTARIKALTVILERDNREHDTQRLVDAISMFEGVAKVVMIETTSEDYLARSRVKLEILKKLQEVLTDNE